MRSGHLALTLAAAGVLLAACTCDSPNAEIRGQLTMTSAEQPPLDVLEAVEPFIGGADIVECLRAETCPELKLSFSNLFENQRDCSDGLPFCFDLALTFTPGRGGDQQVRRLCGEPALASVMRYLQFPHKRAGAVERGVAWQSGCIELRWAGKTLEVLFDDVQLQLDSGRTVRLDGRFGLSHPRDEYTC